RKGPGDVPRSLLLGRDGRAHDGNWNRYAAGRPARLVLIVPDQAAAAEGDGGQEQGQENCDGTKAGRRGSKAQQTTHTIGSRPCRHKWKTTPRSSLDAAGPRDATPRGARATDRLRGTGRPAEAL